MEVRVATPRDARELWGLNALFGNDAPCEAIEKSLVENDREIVCIAYIDGEAAGYCSGLIVKSMCYQEDRADVEALYVKEEHRRRGIGEALMECLETALIERGIRHFHINTYADNKKAARALYKKLGYEETGEILMDKSVPSR